MSRLQAMLILLVATLVSAGGSGERYAHAGQVPAATAVAAAEGGGHAREVLSPSGRSALQTALHSAPLAFDSAVRGNHGPLAHRAGHARRTPVSSLVPASNAIRARLTLVSHLDFAARLAAARAGALSSRATSIPPPPHA